VSDGSNKSSFSFEMKRWSPAERTTAIATLVLFISLFLPWFTYNYGLGSVSVDVCGMDGCISSLFCAGDSCLLVSRAGFSEMPFKLPIAGEQLLLVASVVNLVLTVLAFVDKPGGIGFSGIGWGFGHSWPHAAIVAAVPLECPLSGLDANSDQQKTGRQPFGGARVMLLSGRVSSPSFVCSSTSMFVRFVGS